MQTKLRFRISEQGALCSISPAARKAGFTCEVLDSCHPSDGAPVAIAVTRSRAEAQRIVDAMNRTAALEAGRDERTKKLIEEYRGNADEFGMLKGVLCADHAFDTLTETSRVVRSIFNDLMIAERMDEIRAGK